MDLWSIQPCIYHITFSTNSFDFFTFVMAVVTQFYMTEAENEYVIKGNSAIMKCKIPSFVADFVYVEAWINVDDGTEITYNATDSYG